MSAASKADILQPTNRCPLCANSGDQTPPRSHFEGYKPRQRGGIKLTIILSMLQARAIGCTGTMSPNPVDVSVTKLKETELVRAGLSRMLFP
jgi:hypothetical protein